MGQSATLYRFQKPEFLILSENKDADSVLKISPGYGIFEKTFEGLIFVLATGQKNEIKEVIAEIFYPTRLIGEQFDFSTIEESGIEDAFDAACKAIYYHLPEKVNEISGILESISNEEFERNFNHNELNAELVYPSDLWNAQPEDDNAFNMNRMKVEFQNLKSIFKTASVNGEYLICFTG